MLHVEKQQSWIWDWAKTMPMGLHGVVLFFKLYTICIDIYLYIYICTICIYIVCIYLYIQYVYTYIHIHNDQLKWQFIDVVRRPFGSSFRLPGAGRHSSLGILGPLGLQQIRKSRGVRIGLWDEMNWYDRMVGVI